MPGKVNPPRPLWDWLSAAPADPGPSSPRRSAKVLLSCRSRPAHRITRWLRCHPATHSLPIGYFGARTGGAAALVGRRRAARAHRGDRLPAAGAPPWPAIRWHPSVRPRCSSDEVVLDLYRQTQQQLTCEATHGRPGRRPPSEEPGDLEQVGGLAAGWFTRHFTAACRSEGRTVGVTAPTCHASWQAPMPLRRAT